MWLTLGLTTSAVLAFLGYWLERRDRKFAVLLVDYKSGLIYKLRSEAFELREKLANKEKQNQSTTKEGHRWVPDDKHHRFLYRDGKYDMWVGERMYNGVRQLCIMAIEMCLPNSTKCEWPLSISDMAGLPGRTFGQKTLKAFNYAKENGFLPRYDEPYADKSNAIHFFLGQFHDVDLWYVKGGDVTERIVHCHPPKNGALNKVYRSIGDWEVFAFHWSGPSAAALQIGYDLATERGLVPKIEHE